MRNNFKNQKGMADASILIKVGMFAVLISVGFLAKNWFHTLRMKRDGYVVITTETSDTDSSNPYKKFGY